MAYTRNIFSSTRISRNMLSARTYNALVRSEICDMTIGGLADCTSDQLMKLPAFGEESLYEIHQLLAKFHTCLADERTIQIKPSAS